MCTNHQRPVANHLSWPAEVLGCLMVGAGIGRGTGVIICLRQKHAATEAALTHFFFSQ